MVMDGMMGDGVEVDFGDVEVDAGEKRCDG